MRAVFGASLFVLVATAAAGCNGVLGIQEAQVDPTLVDAGTDASGGLCGPYCDAVMANCTGTSQEYVDRATCITMCAVLEQGSSANPTGNTVACRLAAAQGAGNDQTKCQNAGPLASGACDSPQNRCRNFCTLVDALCHNVSYPDGGVNECNAECPGFSDTATEDIADKNGIITGGNSFNCRLYHLEAANGGTAQDITVHCPHTAKDSATCR